MATIRDRYCPLMIAAQTQKRHGLHATPSQWLCITTRPVLQKRLLTMPGAQDISQPLP
ncbi:Hypothetical protein GbCGDNIH3_7133 [Granulibacter bethesdensis]|uniref:Uncharacterized protein n=1 Tax=Granulibacter bethesdensis TaxID=364410 RepID=A0AAN0RDE7_9PROT|nr:Hypothetical protein GbCGDNIH3_7133 [Granulibacter bethesdensis]AHJ66675.1 Hypothetical protein GbCGDNIH4_7124 [Granulibacter bethesdensis CGDNIH4]APH59262.1 Hypothetical protein GbCGDNIH7_7133 [Granulibacter bethesdensis]